jgi:D-arabinose 5-phosphate isomerase GutQ
VCMTSRLPSSLAQACDIVMVVSNTVKQLECTSAICSDVPVLAATAAERLLVLQHALQPFHLEQQHCLQLEPVAFRANIVRMTKELCLANSAIVRAT